MSMKSMGHALVGLDLGRYSCFPKQVGVEFDFVDDRIARRLHDVGRWRLCELFFRGKDGKVVRFVEFFEADPDKLAELYLLRMLCEQRHHKISFGTGKAIKLDATYDSCGIQHWRVSIFLAGLQEWQPFLLSAFFVGN
jgi:hypothetical protein